MCAIPSLLPSTVSIICSNRQCCQARSAEILQYTPRCCQARSAKICCAAAKHGQRKARKTKKHRIEASETTTESSVGFGRGGVGATRRGWRKLLFVLAYVKDKQSKTQSSFSFLRSQDFVAEKTCLQRKPHPSLQVVTNLQRLRFEGLVYKSGKHYTALQRLSFQCLIYKSGKALQGYDKQTTSKRLGYQTEGLKTIP